MNISLIDQNPDCTTLSGESIQALNRSRLELAGEHQGELTIRPAGASAELGIAFVAEVLPADADILGITAWDRDGYRVDAQRTAHQSRVLRGTDDSTT